MKQYFDFVVIGAGIVGAATAWKLSLKYPNKKIAVLEKEKAAARHQTGRNSGVIHAGVYYKPGSLKAKFCRQGLDETIGFCQQYDIDYRQCGKMIVATNQQEVERLGVIFNNCIDNDLTPEWIEQQNLQRLEPNISGLTAVNVSHSGITDYIAITQKMLSLAAVNGVEIFYNTTVLQISENGEKVNIETDNSVLNHIELEFMVNCAGIYADDLIKQQGLSYDCKLLPFRGEYFRLSKHCEKLTSRLIYPVPDPDLPFLGVHLTPMIGGYITVGPNAVLALGKEAYSKSQFNAKELYEVMTYTGSWKLLLKHLGSGIDEFHSSINKRKYLSLVNKYCAAIQLGDLLPYRAGIRAQAVNSSGQLLHDFVFAKSPRTLHVGNAPSPAATSAMPIADSIVGQI